MAETQKTRVCRHCRAEIKHVRVLTPTRIKWEWCLVSRPGDSSCPVSGRMHEPMPQGE